MPHADKETELGDYWNLLTQETELCGMDPVPMSLWLKGCEDSNKQKFQALQQTSYDSNCSLTFQMAELTSRNFSKSMFMLQWNCYKE